MPTPSSQGSSVSWKGSSLGRVTGFRFSAGSAAYQEVTGVDSTVLGTGDESRMVKQYACTAVEPGTLEVSVFGCPPFVLNDRGSNGTVGLTFNGGGLSADAYLDDFEVSGQVGEFLNGTARFKLSGF